MKNNKTIQHIIFNLLGLVIITSVACKKRDVAGLQAPTLPNTAEVFTDFPVGLTDAFFISFDPNQGANPKGFGVDNNEAHTGRTSIRIDVPDAKDPNGSFIGGIFKDRGNGRNLTQYNALTFWAKGSATGKIGLLGFGNDFEGDKYAASISNIQLSTKWRKYVIPIPEPSKLTQEKGMFTFAAGGLDIIDNIPNGNEIGWTFWLDEIKFEKLGTIGFVNASINNGNNTSVTAFVGVNTTIANTQAIFNLADGTNQVVNIKPSYFEFKSSNTPVASVNSSGVATTLSAGTSVITATMNGKQAGGSLTINCPGVYINAPTPTRAAANVISIFSDAYTNVPVNYYNGYWAPWQTTTSNDFSVGSDKVLNYNNFNFVGMEFSSPTVNATNMTHFHIDAFFPGPIAPGRQLRVIVIDFGPDGKFSGGDDTRHSTTFTSPTLVSQSWVQIDIPFSAMPGLIRRNNVAQIILEGGDNSTLYVDNVYFWR